MKINQILQRTNTDNINFRIKQPTSKIRKNISKLLDLKKGSSLPVVSTPLVVYYINKNKVLEETTKNYRPYTDNLKQAEKLFEQRGLTCKDGYIDYGTGNLNNQGHLIINNYDNAKASFKDAGLNFNNNLIDSSTGKLNVNGQSIYNKYLDAKGALENANIPYNSNYINKNTGLLNSNGDNVIKQKISFHGSDDNLYTPEQDLYEDEPKGFFSNLGAKMKKFFGVNDKTTPNSINEANPLTINEAEEKIRLQEDLKWIDSIDEKMCPECEEIYNAIPNEVPEGLMSDIMADIPEGFAVDNSLLKMLRKMTRDLIGE